MDNALKFFHNLVKDARMRKVVIEELDGGHLITVYVDDEEVSKHGAGAFSSVVTQLRKIFKDKVKTRRSKRANNTIEEIFEA